MTASRTTRSAGGMRDARAPGAPPPPRTPIVAARIAAARTVISVPFQPARLALLQERGEAVLRLVARAHLGQHARERGAERLPGRVGPGLEQGLDAGLGAR